LQRTVPKFAALGRMHWRDLSARYALWVTLALLVVIGQVVSGGVFLEPRNIVNILAQNSIAGVLAVGQTLVILTGGIDLSLGSITALSSEAILMLQNDGPVWPRVVGLVVGIGCGLINGLLVTIGRVPPFIATLGMLQVALGAAYVLTGGYPIYENAHVSLMFGVDQIGPVPLIVVLWALINVVAWIILARTRYGAYIYATGGNERASRVSGINTNRVKLFVYVCAGLCAALAAIISINRLGYTQPTIGDPLTLASIAPVVVGGTSLFGGVGGVGLTIGGVLIVGILNNLMVLLGVNVYIEQVVQGIIILLVVFVFIKQKGR
jgi:ribose/xylose/arabinose/galactoside ABC-type transport system permease subunit